MGAKILQYGSLIGLLCVLELATARVITQQDFLNDILGSSNNVRSSSYGFYAPDEAEIIDITPNFRPYPYSMPRSIEPVKQTTPIELHFRIELPDIKLEIVKDEQQQSSVPRYTPLQQPFEIDFGYNDNELENVKRAENFRFTDLDSIPNYMQKPIAFSFGNPYAKPEFQFDNKPSNNQNIYDQMIVENYEGENQRSDDDEDLENLKTFLKLMTILATISEGDDETLTEYKPTDDDSSAAKSNEKTQDETLDHGLREINYEDEFIKQFFGAPVVKIPDFEIIGADDNDDDVENKDSSESDEDTTTDNSIITTTVAYEQKAEPIDKDDVDEDDYEDGFIKYYLGNRAESEDSTTIATIEAESEEPLPEVVKEINFDSKNIYKVVQPENDNVLDEEEDTPTIHLINEDASQADSKESNEKTAEPILDANQNFYYNANMDKDKEIIDEPITIKNHEEVNRVESKENSNENEDKSDEKLSSNQWKELDSDYEDKLIEEAVNKMLADSFKYEPEDQKQMYEMPIFNYMDYE